MKIIYEYSHLGGSEILQVRYPKINHLIYDVIAAIKPSKSKITNDVLRIHKQTFIFAFRSKHKKYVQHV